MKQVNMQIRQLLCLIILLGSALISHGQYANGTGTGLHQKEIFWLDWDEPVSQPAGATATNIAAGTYIWQLTPTLQIQAVVSNITTVTKSNYGNGVPLTLGKKNVGTFLGNGSTTLGDGLQILYPGPNPIAIATSTMGAVANDVQSGEIRFDIAVSLRLLIGGAYTNITYPGMVVGDAESMATNTTNDEYISGRTNATTAWQLLDLRNDAASIGRDPSEYKLEISNTGKDFKLHINVPRDDIGVQAVMYAHGATSLTNLQMRGRGITAMAVGFVIPFDFGDAPLSYGNAGNYMDNFSFTATLPGTTGTYAPSNLTKATLIPSAKLYMGINDVDADGNPPNSVNADADGADDNSATFPAAINPNQTGNIVVTTTATNTEATTATIYAWIDFDRNGQFEADELVTTTAPAGNNNTAKTLTWTNNSFASIIRPGPTYARIRITTTALTDDPSTTGVDERSTAAAADGETEDYRVNIFTTITGTVFNDVNGLLGTPVNTVDGTPIGRPAAATLYVNLLNAAGTAVVDTVTVRADGTYTLNTFAATGNYILQLSTVKGTIGSAPPATSLPAGWVNTGEFLGTGPGSDGTVSGTLPINIGTTSTTNANFGIDARPVAGSGTNNTVNFNSQTQITVPANTFTNNAVSSDASPGGLTGIRITAFPTGATSIVINGTTYTSANLAALTALIIPTDASGNPTVTITVDPTAAGATTVSIPFVARDAAGVESTNTGTAVLNLTASVTISGNVFDDANGLIGTPANTVDGTGIGTASGVQLYANLTNNGQTSVLDTFRINTNGTYSFEVAANASYTIRLSTVKGTIGAAPPAATLPAGWVYTGENVGAGAGNDGNDGILSVTVGTTAIANANFGIDALPVGSDKTLATVPNPGGTAKVQVPASAFTATDFEDAPTGYANNLTGRSVGLAPVSGGTLYYDGNPVPAGGTLINSFNPALVTFDPTANGATTGSFGYAVLDNAGKLSAGNLVQLSFSELTISGLVYNDPNTNGVVDGTPVNFLGTNTLYAILLNGTTIVSSQAIGSNGTTGAYSFNTTNGVVAGTSYNVIISNSPTSTTPALSGALYNSETDGTVNGSITIPTITTNVSGQNFGVALAGYIYVQKKTLDESSSVDFTFTGSGSIGSIVLNDNPAQIAIKDIGSSTSGRLYAVGTGTTNLYYRDLGSSMWVNTGVTGIARVDGGPALQCYLITTGGSVLFYSGTGTTTTTIGAAANYGSSNATDIGDAWDNTPYIVTAAGLLYKYSGTGTTWAQVGTSTTNVAVDGYPTSSGCVVTRTNNQVYRITAANVETSLGTPAGVSGQAVDVAVDQQGTIYASYPTSGLSGSRVYRWISGTSWSNAEITSNVNFITAGVGGQVWGATTPLSNVAPYGNIYTRTANGTTANWLDDERVRTTPANGNSRMIAVLPGSYTITETVPSGWYLKDITVADPTTNSTTSLTSGLTTVAVAAGETVAAVFTNVLNNPFTIVNDCGSQYLETFGTVSAGQFGAPLTGQTSYHYLGDATITSDGYYKVVGNSYDWANYGGANYFDHTSTNGTGRFMAVNAAYDSLEFFRRRFTGLIVGATYSFNAYVLNLTNSTIKPNVSFIVQNTTNFSQVAKTSSGDITSTGVWTQYGITFVATATSLDLSIVNNALGGNGNDVALDDISFKLTSPPGPLSSSFTNGNCSSGGSITVTAPIGSIYEYSVDGTNYQSSPVFTNLAAGTYIVYARYVGSTNCVITAVITLSPSICGNVFNDINGNAIKDGTEPFITNGSVYANLVNNTNNVIQSVQVQPDGSYSFNTISSGTAYKIILTTSSQTVGASLISATLPAGFANTGVNLGGTANTGNQTGIISITSGSTNFINQNFAIEALPIAGGGANSATNPGGTTQVTVPATTFTNIAVSSDPAPGGVTSIRITALPASATSIVIGNTTYGAGFMAFPAGGVIVPTDANGNPTVAISVDPAAATTPNVTLPFVAIDAAGKESANTGTAVLNLLAPINITGNVFNDVNGNAVKETGEIITGGVYATLVNPVTNAVIRFALIDALGNYSLTANQNTPYKLVLTNSLPTVGATLTASTLPTGFTNTGVNLSGVANTANQTGIISFTTGGADLTAQNFGIEALPTAGSGANSATNPGGTTQVTVPASTFTNTAVSTDPTPGAVTAIRITALPTGATTIFINGVQYGPGFTAFPAGGVVVPTDALGNPTQTITVDPALATTPNVTIPFVAIDAAGKESANTGTAVLNLLAPITVNGSVFNDVNGNAIADGTEPFITNGSVYANLVDASNAVVQSVVVNGSGNYTFNTVSQNTAYSIVLTNSSQTVGASLTTATLPAGFANTGVNLGGTTNTTNQTGIISFTTAGTNITAQNFGIEALPVAGSGSNGGTNPTGAIQVIVPANTFTSTTASTDPTPGAVTAIRITAFPTGATTIFINGIQYGPGFIAFPAGGVIVPTDASGNPTQTITVDPSATGATTVTIPFVARDAAGKESANTGTAVLNLQAPVTISGNVFDDPNGNAVQDAGEPLIVNGSVYANLVNPTTNAVLQSVVVDGTGNYTFSNASQNTAYKVVLTNSAQTINSTLTAATLPAGYASTGVNLGGTANIANQTGVITITTTAVNLTAQNFGIEALPVAGNGANIATNRGGTSQATVPPNTFTNTTASSDPTPGAVTSIRITAFPTGATTIFINGIQYGPGFTAFPAGGVIVPTDASGNPTQIITVDPAAATGATTVTIPFVARDAAGKESANTGTATLNLLASIAISGNVFNDINGNAVLDVVEQYITNGSVYANLVNPTTSAVLQSVQVTATGSYSFPIVSQNTNYNVILTTSSQTGNPNLTASTLPAGFANTGVNLNGVANTANQTGIINFTTTTTDLTAQNFGIEALPMAGNGSLNNVTNPSGTVQITIPANTFTNITASNDPTPGSITGIRITALPTGAATIVINGTTYGPGFTAFPAGGVIVPTDINGNPTQTITIDPAIDGATTVTILFVARDAAGKESANTGTAVINLLAPITISGNVFDDGNGNAVKEAGEPFITNGSVYANLVNPTTNAVIQSVQVDGTGSYTFNGASQNTAYKVVLTNSTQTVNTVLTTSNLPAGFVNTGVNLNGTANLLNQTGIISFTTGTANTTAQNFGIDATPTVTGYTATGLSNPGGTATALVPAASFMGTDPEDGSYGTGLSGRSVVLSPATGGMLFYNGISVTATTTFTNFNPALVTFDPTASGATTGTFSYNVLDNAGRPSATPATVTLQFADISISGIVFNDPNTTPAVDGTPTGTIGTNNLFAILVNGTTIIATQPVAANGTYSFGTANGIVAGNNYRVIISNTDANITPTLTGAVYNSETDGVADGTISLVNLTASVTNQNFGIDRLPTVNSFTAVSVTNPGGTVAVPVPVAAFTGSDPEDGTYTNFTGRRVALGAGVNGTLYYDGMPVPAGGTNVPSFDPAKLTFDPAANGTTTGSFSINVYDNANKPSATPAIISLPFTDLTISGFVYDDPNTNAMVDGIQRGVIGANTLYAVLLDASNNFIARTAIDSASGSYSFGSANGVTAGSNYNIIITNGNTAITPTLVGAVYNSETDGTVNGSISVTNITASVTGQDFGIDQLPVVNNYTAISVANPGGANTVVVPVAAFTGTDPEDGTYPTGLAGRKVALGAGINGTLYYNGIAVPAGGTIITGFDPTKVRFDPNDNIAVGVFSYNVYDEANKPSAITATVTLPFSNVTISGTIYDDPNTNAVVDGTPTNAFTGNTLYAVLLNGTTVVSRKAVAIDGTYSFGTSDGVTTGSNYTIIITNGNTAVTPGLAGAAYNSEADGSANGSITITNITGDVPNLNFGIDRLPVSDVAALPLQLNPGGTGVVAIPANTFTGSDPEDGTYPTGLTGRKVTLASGTNGNVYYNGVLVPTGVGTTINSFDSSLVTFDPIDGSVTSTFTYSVYDNANKPSAPATITIPFRLGVTIAGTIWNDVNGNANIDVAEILLTIPATIYANIVNTDGTVVQSVLVTGGTYTSGLVFADSSYRVILTTTAQTTGNFLTASIITTGWASTGVNPGATTGTANNANRTGILSVSTLGATTGVINRNFGIERIPLANNSTTFAQPNFAPYTQTVASSSFGGSDADLGTIQSIRITSFPANAQTLVVNGVTYGPGFTAFPAGGITIPAPLGVVPPNIISVKPNPGVITVTIPYVTIDNAGIESIGATVIVPYYVILPVTGLDLTGIRNGNDVVLKWNTLTEQNTALFIVERSFDGRNFERIGTVSASGNSNALKSYTITDRSILKDLVYYRVTLVDADGRTTVSNTATVRLNGFVKNNRVFPNPVQNVINIELGMAGRYTITLYNAAGQQVNTRQVETSSSIITSIYRNNLPAGSYILKLTNAATRESETFKLILE